MQSEEHGAGFIDQSDGLADAIGSLFINFALFNSHLNAALSAIYGLSLQQARSFVLPLHPRTKIEGITAYAKHHWEEKDAAYLKEICSTASQITNYRNTIAHGDMIKSEECHTVRLATYKGKHRFDPKLTPIPADAVAHNAMVCLHLGKEFRRLAICISEDRSFERPHPPQE